MFKYALIAGAIVLAACTADRIVAAAGSQDLTETSSYHGSGTAQINNVTPCSSEKCVSITGNISTSIPGAPEGTLTGSATDTACAESKAKEICCTLAGTETLSFCSSDLDVTIAGTHCTNAKRTKGVVKIAKFAITGGVGIFNGASGSGKETISEDLPSGASKISFSVTMPSATPSPTPSATPSPSPIPISSAAYQLLNQRVRENRSGFFVYKNQDDGSNHGFPSGWFGSPGFVERMQIDPGCIDDASQANGCSVNPNALDEVRGTVFQTTFSSQSGNQYVGFNFEEPENWGVLRTGCPYDLAGATKVQFDVRSPDVATIQFGVGGCVTPFMKLPTAWTTKSVPLSSLKSPSYPIIPCPPVLSDTHVLFTVVTNAAHLPGGGTVLLDNVQFTPIPVHQLSALGFPLANQTFGVVPLESPASGPIPFPSDQVLRNLTTIYESSLTELSLLARGTAQDVINAKIIADTFDYALNHDNHGDPLPAGPSGALGLHSGYESGDIALFNDQSPPKMGKAGDVRLAGFSAGTCASSGSGFCLVLDDATGGNNAFAILAQLAAFQQFGDQRYLNDARTISDWIAGNLTDTSGTGFGGYYAGYFGLDTGMAGVLNKGKSTENNADIFAAFSALAAVESRLGNTTAAAMRTAQANVAGDFVMAMFDPVKGRFFAGAVPFGTPPSSGINPTGPQKGNDVINDFDFLDSNTFTTLSMASAPRYQSQIDWRIPIQFVVSTFAQTVSAAGQRFNGFNIIQNPTSGPNGVAWEFTGQACEAMQFVDQLYGVTTFASAATSCVADIATAQLSAPFGDGQGLVASTMQNGDTLAPIDQCLNTPYQCIAERVGLGATNWAIFAKQGINIFIRY